MSASIVVCVLAAICICTIHLFFGYVLGQRAAGKEQIAVAEGGVIVLPQIEKLTDQLREHLADVVSLTSQARALSEECDRSDPKLPTNIVSRVDSIAYGSALLQERVETMTRNEDSVTRDVLQPASNQGERGCDTTQLARFRYEAWQHVAPMYDEDLPAASQFEAVQCRDLSREGFSFFAENLPTAEMLVVALGNPPNLRYFTARVASSPAVARHGKVGFQIECAFVSKLTEAYEWDQQNGRIISASSRGAERVFQAAAY